MFKLIFTDKGHRVVGREWNGRTLNEPYTRLYYIVEGDAEIEHNGSTISLKPGYLYLIPPMSNMKYSCRSSFEVIWFHFNITFYGDIDIFQHHSCSFIRKAAEPVAMQRQFEELLEQTEGDDLSSDLKAKSLLLGIIAPFFKVKQGEIKQAVSSYERFNKVLSYIDDHLGETLSIDDLARLAVLETTYFSTLFKKTFGISPKRFIIKRRIDKARIMLRTGNKKLNEIALELGFNDTFHFSKTFMSLTGDRPSFYKRRFLKRLP